MKLKSFCTEKETINRLQNEGKNVQLHFKQEVNSRTYKGLQKLKTKEIKLLINQHEQFSKEWQVDTKRGTCLTFMKS